MQIIWKGQSCFQIIASRGKQEQVKIVIDPFDESFGLKLPPMEADILLMTHNHYDHNNEKGVKGPSASLGQAPFVIGNPGEYDVGGVAIRGIFSYHDNVQGKERGANTIYVAEVEDLKICHLGDLGQKELTPDQLEAIGDIDILFVPVGGTYTIEPKDAADVVAAIEPKIAIPMHYALPKIKEKLAGVEEFLKIMGAKSAIPQEKLTVKAKDLIQEETQIIVLQP